MPIIKPSQYECDKMKIGDMVFVNKPTFLYSWFRRHFLKSLPKTTTGELLLDVSTGFSSYLSGK